ncbi:MAG: ATP-binding cassette domain-containing protein [Candidatus Aenigmatarchaeota archaeon]
MPRLNYDSNKKPSKKFDDFVAVKDLNLKIKKGTIYGLLGRNGAGKTTLLKMMACILKPSSGAAFIGGFDVSVDQEEIKQMIGVVPQENRFSGNLTAKEYLALFGRIRGLSGDKLKKRILEVVKLLDIEDCQNRVTKNFSTGIKKRLSIAMAIIHKPDVLFLDEPTTGLDPSIKREIWKFIKEIKNQGTTIVMTTHYMEEADSLCDVVGIMDGGKLIKEGRPKDLKKELGAEYVIEIEAKNIEPEKLNGVIDFIRNNGDVFEFFTKRPAKLVSQIMSQDKVRKTLKAIHIREPTLEDVFLSLTGKRLEE